MLSKLVLFAFAVMVTACSTAAPSASLPTRPPATATRLPPTHTAVVPSATPTHTTVPSATPLPTSTNTPTPRPTRTPPPTATEPPTPTSTSTRIPATLAPPTATEAPAPDFVGVALAVRAQVDNFAWQIDLTSRRFGGHWGLHVDLPLHGDERDLDCRAAVYAYEYVAARSTLTVPDTLAGPYDQYTRAANHFLADAKGLYLNCQDFLVDINVDHYITTSQWENALTASRTARNLLTEAIIAAGGTP